MIKYFIIYLLITLYAMPLTNSNSTNIKITKKTNKIIKKVLLKTRYEQFLKYGTFSQKIEVIKNIKKFKKLSSLIQFTKKDFLKNEIYGINVLDYIENLKEEKYYNFIDIIVENKSNIIEKKYFKLLTKSIEMINNLKLEKYKGFILGLYNIKNNNLKIQYVKTIGIFKIKESKNKLKELYKTSDNVYVKSGIIKAIGKFQQDEDIDFFERVIFSDLSSPINQWVSVVALKNFINNKKAENLLVKCLSMNNIEIKSRALYALSFFNNTKIYNLLLEYSQNDSPRLRYFAIKGLENYNDDKVNNILKFKYENDSEIKIKNLAKKILIKRKIIKEEKKKDGTKD